MCQPANQDARGRFERERQVAALLRGGPRGEKSFCLHGDPGPASRCGPVGAARPVPEWMGRHEAAARGPCLFSVLRESASGASACLPLSPPSVPTLRDPLPLLLLWAAAPPPPRCRPLIPPPPRRGPHQTGKAGEGEVKTENRGPSRPGTPGKRWVSRPGPDLCASESGKSSPGRL